jgi:catechol 2,3-dioxygenase-like lactoylglutathione lyase family enzyme
MKQRINLLTLGVDDLERSLRFYRDGLGLRTKGIVGKEFEHGAVVFFDLSEGMKVALYERKNLAWDCGLELQSGKSAAFSIGHLVNSKEEVDDIMEQAKLAGADIVKNAEKTFWGGYAGYFQDPDGHLWEIAWNPGWKVED